MRSICLSEMLRCVRLERLQASFEIGGESRPRRVQFPQFIHIVALGGIADADFTDVIVAEFNHGSCGRISIRESASRSGAEGFMKFAKITGCIILPLVEGRESLQDRPCLLPVWKLRQGKLEGTAQDAVETERRGFFRPARGNVSIRYQAYLQDEGQETVQVMQELAVWHGVPACSAWWGLSCISGLSEEVVCFLVRAVSAFEISAKLGQVREQEAAPYQCNQPSLRGSERQGKEWPAVIIEPAEEILGSGTDIALLRDAEPPPAGRAAGYRGGRRGLPSG